MIAEAEITQIADTFLGAQDLRGFKYELLSARPAKRVHGKWDVAYQVTTPSGKLLDGPAIVVVDEATKTGAFLESP